MHFSGVRTTEIHKAVEKIGGRLGSVGKEMVRTMRAKFDQDKALETGGLNDAQLLVNQLMQEKAFMRFMVDQEGRLVAIAWAHEPQRQNAVRYHSGISKTTLSTPTSTSTNWR